MQDSYFDIQWIIDLLKQQYPERLDLIEDLNKQSIRKWVGQAYVYFVSSERVNQPGAEWQFDENIVLEHETEGTIVLDVPVPQCLPLGKQAR